MDAIAEVRRFNRFYTRRIGLLGESLAGGELPLAPARVLYELAHGEQTAADLARRLDMDKGHLSRLLTRLKSQGLVAARVSPVHAKQRLLCLTPAGKQAFSAMDQGARAHMETILSPLGPEARGQLVKAMHTVQQALAAEAAGDVVLRGLQPGDIGWIVHRQALIYHREHGWDLTYEGLIAGILSDFVRDFDPARDQAWVADRDGSILGSVFLVKTDDPAVAKLRLLYVEPHGRGQGLGSRLVRACVERARALGYRRLTLWTNDVLVSARRIYQAAGFTLESEAPLQAFGRALHSQTWSLDLAAPG